MDRKSLLLSGTLGGNRKLVYKPCPSTEFVNGRWFVQINSFATVCRQEGSSALCTLKSNFVRNKQFSGQGEVITYEQPLIQFLIEHGKTMHHIHSEPFYMNAISEQFEISLKNDETEENTVADFYILLSFFKK